MKYKLLGFVLIHIIIIGWTANSTDINSNEISDTRIGKQVPDFTLTNLDYEPVSFNNDEGKIRLVTWMYTQCLDNCGSFTSSLMFLLNDLKQQGYEDEVKFFNIDFDYLFDDIGDLRDYAKLVSPFGIVPEEFEFLHGTEEEIKSQTHEWEYQLELGDVSNVKPQGVVYYCGGVFHDGEVDVVWLHNYEVYVIDKNGLIHEIYSSLNWNHAEVFQTFMTILES